MEKIDVSVQSYKKPESLVYTLFSLKKYCGELIDTVYINDDGSNNGTVECYTDEKFKQMMAPINIKVRVNEKPGKYTKTLMTKELFKRKSLGKKIQLLLHTFIDRIQWHDTEEDIRYQWAINQTDKKYLFIIHDDIKFFDNVLALYLEDIKSGGHAVVGDFGGCELCRFGPCGEEGKCGPEKIMAGIYPCKSWPRMGYKTPIHMILGRSTRHCRINEWCCLIDVAAARELTEKEGTCIGNYEAGGDTATYWFERVIKRGYTFHDPLPCKADKKKWYLHWWQGYEGHSIWTAAETHGKCDYNDQLILDCLKQEFGYEMISHKSKM